MFVGSFIAKVKKIDVSLILDIWQLTIADLFQLSAGKLNLELNETSSAF